SLAFPFAEPWLQVVLSGAALRRGLERAARRSAARHCESTLQVSGLKLRVACAACARGAANCLEATRPAPWGGAPLDDGAILVVALPSYLTLPGADFAGLEGIPLGFSVV